MAHVWRSALPSAGRLPYYACGAYDASAEAEKLLLE
jgi:hypothetical protein